MSTKYRDLFKAKVKGAIPITLDEQSLFDLAMEEERREKLAEAIAQKLSDQQNRRVGAPWKTGDDLKLAKQLLARHHGDTKLARQEFIKELCDRDNIQKKRARARFKAALESIQA